MLLTEHPMRGNPFKKIHPVFIFIIDDGFISSALLIWSTIVFGTLKAEAGQRVSRRASKWNEEAMLDAHFPFCILCHLYDRTQCS